jgi:predicted nucleic acid-binding protein
LPDIICNTSPIQYLHQLGLLHLLPSLTDRITIPSAVAEELDEGRRLGVSLPDIGTLAWVTIRSPHSMPVLRLVTDLGPGETEVLALWELAW